MAHSKNNASDADTPEVRNNKDKSRRNRYKRRNNSDNTEDTTVNAEFRGSKSSQRKKPFEKNNSGPSSLDRILDRPCQIHGTPDKPPNHNNRDCWVFKHANKLNAENKDKGSQSEDDDKEPRPPNTGGQKKFPPQVKMVNMIYATHIPKRERKRALRDVYTIELVEGVLD